MPRFGSLSRYWADIQRAEEREENRRYIEERGPLTLAKVIKNRFSKGIHEERAAKEKKNVANKGAQDFGATAGSPQDETKVGEITSTTSSGIVVTEEEWKTSARALRTASWGTMFYIITTDILGWGSCP